jgi:hypothetical protein
MASTLEMSRHTGKITLSVKEGEQVGGFGAHRGHGGMTFRGFTNSTPTFRCGCNDTVFAGWEEMVDNEFARVTFEAYAQTHYVVRDVKWVGNGFAAADSTRRLVHKNDLAKVLGPGCIEHFDSGVGFAGRAWVCDDHGEAIEDMHAFSLTDPAYETL